MMEKSCQLAISMTEPSFPAKGDAGSAMRLGREGEGAARAGHSTESHSTEELCCEPGMSFET